MSVTLITVFSLFRKVLNDPTDKYSDFILIKILIQTLGK